MYFRLLLFFFISTFPLSIIFSQTNNPIEPCFFCKDGKHLNTSPYNKGFKNELPYIISGVGLMTSGFLLQSMNSPMPFTADQVNKLNRNEVNAFDRPATYNWNTNAATASDFLTIGAMALPALFLSTKHTRSELGSLVVMGLEVGMINYGFTLSVKHIANRARPFVYNSEAPLDEKTGSRTRDSFFSGHTSSAAAFSFFFARVLSDYHPNMKSGLKITMWTIAVALPASTAYLRVKSGNHFKTDVITGFAIGACTGWLIPHLHKKKNKASHFSIFPGAIRGKPGMYFSYRF